MTVTPKAQGNLLSFRMRNPKGHGCQEQLGMPQSTGFSHRSREHRHPQSSFPRQTQSELWEPGPVYASTF